MTQSSRATSPLQKHLEQQREQGGILSKYLPRYADIPLDRFPIFSLGRVSFLDLGLFVFFRHEFCMFWIYLLLDLPIRNSFAPNFLKKKKDEYKCHKYQYNELLISTQATSLEIDKTPQTFPQAILLFQSHYFHIISTMILTPHMGKDARTPISGITISNHLNDYFNLVFLPTHNMLCTISSHPS